MVKCKCCGEYVIGSSLEDPDVCWRCGIEVMMRRRVIEVKKALRDIRGQKC